MAWQAQQRRDRRGQLLLRQQNYLWLLPSEKTKAAPSLAQKEEEERWECSRQVLHSAYLHGWSIYRSQTFNILEERASVANEISRPIHLGIREETEDEEKMKGFGRWHVLYLGVDVLDAARVSGRECGVVVARPVQLPRHVVAVVVGGVGGRGDTIAAPVGQRAEVLRPRRGGRGGRRPPRRADASAAIAPSQVDGVRYGGRRGGMLVLLLLPSSSLVHSTATRERRGIRA